MRRKSMSSSIRSYRKSGNMFAQTVSVPGAVARSNACDQRIDIYRAGCTAYDEGAALDANPHPARSPDSEQWSNGWIASWRSEGHPATRV